MGSEQHGWLTFSGLRTLCNDIVTMHSKRVVRLLDFRQGEGGPEMLTESWLPSGGEAEAQCPICTRPFVPASPRQEYCSTKCRVKAHRLRKNVDELNAGLGVPLEQVLQEAGLADEPSASEVELFGLQTPSYESNEPNWRVDDEAPSYEEDQ